MPKKKQLEKLRIKTNIHLQINHIKFVYNISHFLLQIDYNQQKKTKNSLITDKKLRAESHTNYSKFEMQICINLQHICNNELKKSYNSFEIMKYKTHWNIFR